MFQGIAFDALMNAPFVWMLIEGFGAPRASIFSGWSRYAALALSCIHLAFGYFFFFNPTAMLEPETIT